MRNDPLCFLLRAALILSCFLVTGVHAPLAAAESPPSAATTVPVRLSDLPEIDEGFHLLYELKFPEARAVFLGWENRHPGEALGPAARAASYLFEEFDRQGVLTSEFFLNDATFLRGVQGKPDPQRRKAFSAAVGQAQQLARGRLRSNPHDADALFALTIATGMLADYTSLIERRQLDGLSLTREADHVAKDLLAVAPGAADAYVALGAANYLIGSLPGYKRFFIWFGGFHGDRDEGMRQLGIAAERGHYLRPFAKVMLGLAAMRENRWRLAQTEFEELAAEFPENPKFARELEKLEETPGPAGSN
jgi:hypothetical protein